MDTANELLPHLKLRFNIEHPELEGCWSEGYTHAQNDGDELENPYEDNTIEAEYWQQGWWAGFYGESVCLDATSVQNEAKMTRVSVNKAANESSWNSEQILRWTANVVKVVSVVAVTVAAIELLDLAS